MCGHTVSGFAAISWFSILEIARELWHLISSFPWTIVAWNIYKISRGNDVSLQSQIYFFCSSSVDHRIRTDASVFIWVRLCEKVSGDYVKIFGEKIWLGCRNIKI